MGEPRPYRDALTPAQAATELAGEVRAARLDGDAVEAVLKAAGQRSTARRAWPDGLTARDVEVLALVARGFTNRQIAERLTLAPKTVSNHTDHIYAKIGVSARAAASLYASRHGLVGAYETVPWGIENRVVSMFGSHLFYEGLVGLWAWCRSAAAI